MYVPELNCFMRLFVREVGDGSFPRLPAKNRGIPGVITREDKDRIRIPGYNGQWWITLDAGTKAVNLRKSVIGWYLDILGPGALDDDVPELVDMGVEDVRT